MGFYELLIVIYCLLSWFPMRQGGIVYDFAVVLDRLVGPYLNFFRRIIPPMGNEIITLIKDTCLARIISNKEIIMMANEYSSSGLIWPLFSTGLFFLVFVGALTLLFGWLEKKLSYFR